MVIYAVTHKKTATGRPQEEEEEEQRSFHFRFVKEIWKWYCSTGEGKERKSAVEEIHTKTSTTTTTTYSTPIVPIAPVTGVAVDVGVGAVHAEDHQQQKPLRQFHYQMRNAKGSTIQ